MQPTTKWTRSGQYKIIKSIVDKYPTAADFKRNCPNTELTKLLSDNADRTQYIDFLQNVVVKYSNTGKILGGLLASIGISAGLAYLAKRDTQNREQRVAEKTARNVNPLADKIEQQKQHGKNLSSAIKDYNDTLKNKDDIIKAYGENEAAKYYNAQRQPLDNLIKKYGTARDIAQKQVNLAQQKNDAENSIRAWNERQIRRDARAKTGRGLTAIAGGLVGGGLLNTWDNKYRDRIEALKNS